MGCSRKACHSKTALWIHTQSGLPYCGSCARQINYAADRMLIRRRIDAVTRLGQLAKDTDA